MELTPYELKVLQATPAKYDHSLPLSWIGQRVWPKKPNGRAEYKAQGLARMTGKFMHKLNEKGLVRYNFEQNGYSQSQKGRKYLEGIGNEK